MLVSETQFNQIKKLYESGERICNISQKLNITYPNINYQIDLIKNNKTRTYFTPENENFFETIDSEEKSYWLGFIYADGCIHSGGNLSINLSQTDEEHLRKLSKIFNKKLDYNSDFARLQICNHKIYTDLTNQGIEENKTYSDTVHVLEYIPDSLLHHFVRGEFDGDGCISKNYGNNYVMQGKFEIVGNLDFLQKLQKIIQPLLDLNETEISQTSESSWKLCYGGNKQVERIYDWMYKDATIWLERKRDTFIEILKLNTQYKDRENSPYKGAYLNRREVWTAMCSFNNKLKHIKYCESELEAAYYHDLEQVKQRGEKAKRYMNFPSQYKNFVEWIADGY